MATTAAHPDSGAGEHDERRIANVHPSGWTNPTPAGRYHLVVVGAGTGGLVTAAIAAGLGARVALVERKLMGGDCLNVGCVPSKALIAAARAWHASHTAPSFGGPAPAGAGDFAAAMERMRRLRADISRHDSAARFSELGVDVFLGDASFTAPDALEVDGQRLVFRKAVIATGGRPAIPPIPGLAEAQPLTNETVWDLTTLPRHLLVIGAGPIGCELAQTFARFGSEVTLLDQAERILPNDDADAAAVVQASLASDGVHFIGGASIAAVESSGEGRTVRFTLADAEREVHADGLLVAAGRRPNVEGLGLEKARVTYGKGGIGTDDRLRTSNEHIYAIGDVAARLQFTHTADAHARMVVRNALFFGRGNKNDLIIPWCTYTSPELAHVGISAEEVEKRGDEVNTITIPLADVDRAVLDGETDGFFRVHLRADSDHILGATMVAQHAGDIISQVTQAMTAGIGLGKLGETIFPYPTQAEAIRKAADAWSRTRLTPLAKSVFDSYFGILS